MPIMDYSLGNVARAAVAAPVNLVRMITGLDVISSTNRYVKLAKNNPAAYKKMGIVNVDAILFGLIGGPVTQNAGNAFGVWAGLAYSGVLDLSWGDGLLIATGAGTAFIARVVVQGIIHDSHKMLEDNLQEQGITRERTDIERMLDKGTVPAYMLAPQEF